jgi:branched-chain amino acid transport system permease protein
MDPQGLKEKSDALYLLALVAFLAMVPFFIESSYYFLVLNIIALNTIVVVGLNLLIGYAGQISMGHAAFFGLGAYLSAMVTTNVHLAAWIPGWFPLWLIPWLVMILAMMCTGAVACLTGIPTLKLKGNYLVMATLGLNIIFEIMLVEWDSLTGGANGMSGIPYLSVGDFALNSDLRFYYFVWGIALLTIMVSLSLVDSRVGRALKAIHGGEVAANTLGIDTQAYKVKVFALSAMYASLAGSLYAHYITVITPKSCDIVYSIQVVIMVIVGGLGRVWGALFGAALLTILSEFLHVVEKFNVVALGLILMLVMIFFPEGLIPGVRRLFRKGPEPGVQLSQLPEPDSLK